MNCQTCKHSSALDDDCPNQECHYFEEETEYVTPAKLGNAIYHAMIAFRDKCAELEAERGISRAKRR